MLSKFLLSVVCCTLCIGSLPVASFAATKTEKIKARYSFKKGQKNKKALEKIRNK